ncbi:MAG: multidrug effflux MFS transporter [Desulfovibrionaceae bacterium]|nr:multidrug effflux MFS transporter [Desulfovibrionaceae bacterium]
MPLLKSPMDRRTGAAWLLTTCILAWTDAFGPLCTDMYLPCLPALALDLDISAALAQSSITATFIGMALGQLILGPLSDGLGRRRLLLASCLLFAAASLMCMQARSGPELLALRFLQGFGGAGGAVLTRSICCDLYQGPTLTAYLAMLLAINCAAPILSPVAGGFVGAEWGWPAIFLVLGAAGLVLALAVLLAIPETLPPERRVKGGMAASLTNAARLFRCRGFVLYLGVQGFTHAGFFAYIAASPFILQNIYGISQQSYGLLFGAIAVGLLTSSMLAARLAGRIGNVRMLVAGDSLRAAACLAVLAACVIMPASPVPLLCGVFAMVVLQDRDGQLRACRSLAGRRRGGRLRRAGRDRLSGRRHLLAHSGPGRRCLGAALRPGGRRERSGLPGLRAGRRAAYGPGRGMRPRVTLPGASGLLAVPRKRRPKKNFFSMMQSDCFLPSKRSMPAPHLRPRRAARADTGP